MKVQNRQQVLVVVTLVVLGLYLGNWIVYEPMIKWWQTRQAKVADLSKQVHQGKLLIRRESYIRSQWEHIRSSSLANDSSQAEQQVLKAVDNWAGDSGVNVDSITPQWQNDQDDYSTLDCRVEAKGDIGSISRFLYEIEDGPMDIQLETIALTATDDKGQSLSLGLDLSGLALVSTQP